MLIFWGRCVDTSTLFANLSLFFELLLSFLHLFLLLEHLFIHSHFLHFAVFHDRYTIVFLTLIFLLAFLLTIKLCLKLLEALLDSFELTRFHFVTLPHASRQVIILSCTFMTHLFFHLFSLIIGSIFNSNHCTSIFAYLFLCYFIFNYPGRCPLSILLTDLKWLKWLKMIHINQSSEDFLIKQEVKKEVIYLINFTSYSTLEWIKLLLYFSRWINNHL